VVKVYEPLYTVKEVSKILKVNTDTVYEFINRGQVPCLILGFKKYGELIWRGLLSSIRRQILN